MTAAFSDFRDTSLATHLSHRLKRGFISSTIGSFLWLPNLTWTQDSRSNHKIISQGLTSYTNNSLPFSTQISLIPRSRIFASFLLCEFTYWKFPTTFWDQYLMFWQISHHILKCLRKKIFGHYLVTRLKRAQGTNGALV